MKESRKAKENTENCLKMNFLLRYFELSPFLSFMLSTIQTEANGLGQKRIALSYLIQTFHLLPLTFWRCQLSWTWTKLINMTLVVSALIKTEKVDLICFPACDFFHDMMTVLPSKKSYWTPGFDEALFSADRILSKIIRFFLIKKICILCIYFWNCSLVI